jgi:hypothetical protein
LQLLSYLQIWLNAQVRGERIAVPSHS